MSCRLFCRKYGLFLPRSNGLFYKSAALNIKIWPMKKISYVHGASDTPLLYKTLGGLLTEVTDQNPDKIAVVSCHQNIRKTYEQLHHDVTRLAAGLLAIGLTRGDKVAIISPNHYEWIVTQFATATAGLALTTINPAFTGIEIKFALNKAECKAVVMSDGFKELNYFDILSSIIPNLPAQNRGDISCKEVPNLKSIITFNSEVKQSTFSFEDIISCGEEKAAKLKLESQIKILQPDDVANIQFTSGTTGFPKAVLLSHHMILNNAYFVGRRIHYTSKNDVICIPVPLFHCFGNTLGTTAAVCFGLTIVLPSPIFSANAAIKAINDENCTMVYGTPTMFVDMLHNENLRKFNLSSLRAGFIGGSTCPEELLKAMISNMNIETLTVGYGTTENSPAITLTRPEDPIHVKCSSVGSTMDHVELKIIDRNGCTVKRGEMGELCARGYQVMKGYLNEPEKTKEVLDDDRWYNTGDLATMDDQGYIRIVGRIKDMIIRGGENIYPREIEEFLHTHPDIAEAQIFGIPDQRLGEIVCSWIKLKKSKTLTEKQVQEFCKDKIAKFKIPKNVIFVNEFPTTQSGKIQKFKLREITIKEVAKLHGN